MLAFHLYYPTVLFSSVLQMCTQDSTGQDKDCGVRTVHVFPLHRNLDNSSWNFNAPFKHQEKIRCGFFLNVDE